MESAADVGAGYEQDFDNDAGLYDISFEDEPVADDAVPLSAMETASVGAVERSSAALKYRRSRSSSELLTHQQPPKVLSKARSFHASSPDKSAVRGLTNAATDTVWSQQFDPRTKTYYYVNAATGECTETKPRFVSKGGAREPMHNAALNIQCNWRAHLARQDVQRRRAAAPTRTTEPPTTIQILHDAYDRKCKLIRLKIADLERAVENRRPDDAFPHLSDLVREFEESIDAIRSTFSAVEAVIDENQDILHLRCDDINPTLTQVQSSCLRLHKAILSHEYAFLDLDAARVNAAWRQFLSWPVPHGALEKAYLRAEGLLRKTMGITAFQSKQGLDPTKLPPHVFDEWHVQVVSLQESIHAYAELMAIEAGKERVVEAPPSDVIEKEEPDVVIEEAPQPKRVRRPGGAYDVAELQRCWARGLALRDRDEAVAIQAEKDAVKARVAELGRICAAQEKFRLERCRRKLSIWEAVIEGWPVEKINQLALAETKKAAQDGTTPFRLRDSQAENGRTLLQLACWWGHVHLVRYLVEKGSKLGQFDCVNNRFSLLHDAARAGRAEVIRVLIEYGLPVNIVDSHGDTPLHWAARRNHVDAVRALLDLPLKELPTSTTVFTSLQVSRWRSVVTPNCHGKRPVQLTSLFQLRKQLTEYQEIAERGLELYERQGASETAMLKRRQGLAPPQAQRRGSPSFTSGRVMQSPDDSAATPSSRNSFVMNNEMSVDERRQREVRVRKATARAVKNFEKEGRKRANVIHASHALKRGLRTSLMNAHDPGDMDIFLDEIDDE
ncbi:hypothetical protein AeMF1_013077 [Aphanomyces euteiches]|nr:hypothetical protein AeMF1_013077 [Aphanomyces euteiches]KAH9196053.1 hypothetical protein AeNC1_001989 [Aphanomyces euteiches]